MSKVYHYSPETGELLGSSDAPVSPLEKGKYLDIAGASKVEPPAVGDKEVPVWTGDAWEVRADHRGEKRYSTETGQEVTVEKIGALADVAPDTTDKPRPTQYHYWKGGKWVHDKAAARAALEAEMEGAVQARLDDFARLRGYSSILSACTYATSQNLTYAREGQYAVQVRDTTWTAAYDAMPNCTSVAELIEALPPLEWPKEE